MRQALTRLAYRFLWWSGSKGPRPHLSDIAAFETAWDYAEADKQDWTREPELDRFSEAMVLRATDRQAAIAEFRALAAVGSPGALDQLGEAYYYGRGLPRDQSEGERWFRRAFEAGSWRGLLNYGKVLFARRDLDAAAAVFAAGVRQRFGPAYYWLFRIEGNRPGPLTSRTKRAMPWLVRASKVGSPSGRGTLGALMMVGLFGCRRRIRGKKLFDETCAAITAQASANLTH